MSGLGKIEAIRLATRSQVLRAICEQILADEVPHIRFQCERLAILHRSRPAPLRALTMAVHRICFTGITLAVWVGHRRALRAGGYHFSRFWRSAWAKMRIAWRQMTPARDRFGDETDSSLIVSKAVAEADGVWRSRHI